MAKPDISSIISTLPGSPTRGHILWSKVFDERLEQLVWKAEILVPQGWEPGDAPVGFFLEVDNSPRSSKESLLIIKALAGVDLPPGVVTGITNAIGSLGLDELEKSEGFTDVIKLSSFVNNDFTAPPSTFTYQGQSYNLQDYKLLHVDENNRKLQAIYIRAGRTYNNTKWFGDWGGALGTITRNFSTTSLSVSSGLLVIDAEARQLEDGTYMSETFATTGSWPALTLKEADEQQAIRTKILQVVGAGTTAGSITSDNTTITTIEAQPIDFLRERRITTTETVVGPELTSVMRSELDTEKTEVSQVIAAATAVTTGRVLDGSNIIETSAKQIDRFRKEKVVETEPVAGPALDSKTFNQYDIQPTTTEQIISEAAKQSGATFDTGTHLLTTKEYREVDSLRAQQLIRVEELAGPELYDSTYNPELGNFSTVIKQVVPRPDLYTPVAWENSVTIGASNIVVVERKDLDRWRTLKMTSTLDFGGLTAFGTSSGFYKKWDGYAEVDLPPEVTSVSWAEAKSTSGTAADYAFQVGFNLRKLQRVYPAEFYRFYSVQPTAALLTAMINATAAVSSDCGSGASKLLDYGIKTKDVLVATSYWGSGSSIQTISTPNAFWDPTISFSKTLSPSPFEAYVVPNSGSATTIAFTGTDFTARPTVKKVAQIKPKEWFGSLWVTDVIVVNFADLP